MASDGLVVADSAAGRRTKRWLIGGSALVAVLALVLSGCVIDGSWTAIGVPTLAGQTYSFIDDVDCVADDWCLAVGSAQVADAGVPFAQVWDGTSWQALPSPPGEWFLEVECGAPNRCVGRVFDGSGDRDDLVAWNGTSWLPVPPGSNTIHDDAPFDCTADGMCVIVQTLDHRTTTWDGSSFHDVPYVAGGADDPRAEDIDCQRATDCLAVGELGRTSRWDGTAWTALPAVLGMDRAAIDCPTSTRCVAVGETAGDEALATWDGSAWTPAAVPAGVDSSLIDVSCASASECVAVGSVWVMPPSTKRPVELAWNGTDWYVAPDAPGGERGTYEAVSCVPTTCLAVGYVGPASGDITQTLAATYAWTNP